MLTLDIAKMIDTKRDVVLKLQELLKADPKSGVDRLAYKVTMAGDKPTEEGIVIYFANGDTKRICTTCNSNAANIKAVHRAVYGEEIW